MRGDPSGSEGGPGRRTVGNAGAAPRARPYRLANNGSPSPRLTSRELPVTEKEPLLAGVVSGRRFAVAEVDGLDRNGWTISPGIVTQAPFAQMSLPCVSRPHYVCLAQGMALPHRARFGGWQGDGGRAPNPGSQGFPIALG